MPQWIHDRALHIREKNPNMPESMSWAIATQQAHASGKSPKGYGTTEGKQEAKQKYDAPKKSYEKQADPPSEKNAGLKALLTPLKIKNEERTRQIVRDEIERSKMPSIETPSVKNKTAGISSPFSLPFIEGFSSEMKKISQLNAMKPTASLGEVKTSIPKPSIGAGKYSKVNSAQPDSPIAFHQPVLDPPSVRR